MNINASSPDSLRAFTACRAEVDEAVAGLRVLQRNAELTSRVDPRGLATAITNIETGALWLARAASEA